MNKNLLRRALVVIAVAATIAVNTLANALPLNGLQTGQISDTFPVYFVPAGYVFSIWGLIYVGLIAYAIYQALPAQRENARVQGIAGWFLLGSAANIAWIFLWHYLLFPLTLVAMVVLLVALVAIYLRLDIGRANPPTPERWLVDLPFSIYLGWITVATVANVTAVLYDLGWNGFGVSDEAWLAIMLGVALVVAALMALTRRDVAYLLVLAWAFAGIGVKHAAVPTVAVAAWVATALALAMAAASGLAREPQASAPTAA
ncbi:MAG: tryptophan-rich sensory protein [Caldilineales bacterium]|nr:tryptophan-rich sensory protein [Caldilineales bacterium]MDW8316845.1 tryptophan-rich sensory protein [Anaerolineae bacterium]